MTGFELRISGFGSDSSTNCATTTAPHDLKCLSSVKFYCCHKEKKEAQSNMKVRDLAIF